MTMPELMDMQKLGPNIEMWRKLRGLTQKDMEKRTTAAGYRVDQGFLSSIEKGKKRPSLQRLQAIAQALGVGIAQLEEGPPGMNIQGVTAQIRTQEALKLLIGWAEADVIELIRIGQLLPPDKRGFFLRCLRRIIPPLLDVLEGIYSGAETQHEPHSTAHLSL